MRFDKYKKKNLLNPKYDFAQARAFFIHFFNYNGGSTPSPLPTLLPNQIIFNYFGLTSYRLEEHFVKVSSLFG